MLALLSRRASVEKPIAGKRTTREARPANSFVRLVSATGYHHCWTSFRIQDELPTPASCRFERVLFDEEMETAERRRVRCPNC
jgi:hypothetical protein